VFPKLWLLLGWLVAHAEVDPSRLVSPVIIGRPSSGPRSQRPERPERSANPTDALVYLETMIFANKDPKVGRLLVRQLADRAHDPSRARTLLREILFAEKAPDVETRVACRQEAALALADLGIQTNRLLRRMISEDLLIAAQGAKEPYALSIAEALAILAGADREFSETLVAKVIDLSLSPSVRLCLFQTYLARGNEPEAWAEAARILAARENEPFLASVAAEYLVRRGLDLENILPRFARPETLRILKSRVATALMACPIPSMIPHPFLRGLLTSREINLDVKSAIALWLIRERIEPDATVAYYAARSTQATEDVDLRTTLTEWAKRSDIRDSLFGALNKGSEKTRPWIADILMDSTTNPERCLSLLIDAKPVPPIRPDSK
jgi:hypothetical protein